MNKITLTEVEQSILDEVMGSIDRSEKPTATELAERCHVAPSTVIKLAKKMGYSGYSEFYFTQFAKKNNKITIDLENFEYLVSGSLEYNLKIISDLMYHYRDARHIVIAMGYCSPLMSYFLDKLAQFDFNALSTYHDEVIFSEKFEKGIMFLLSESGMPLNGFALKGKQSGYNVISFTADPNSVVAKNSTMSIEITNRRTKKDEYEPNFFTAKLVMFIELLFSQYSKTMIEEEANKVT